MGISPYAQLGVGMKVKVSVSLEKELYEKAHRLGINVSKACENSLETMIDAIEQQSTENRFLVKFFPQKKVLWCGRRDSNPGRQRGRLMS